MIFESKGVTLKIIAESCYTPGSVDNIRSYPIEYNLDPEHRAASVYGLCCNDGYRCVVLAGGGATSVSANSAIIIDSTAWVGIGDSLLCLSLPTLEKLWHVKVDDATCFGVFDSPDRRGLLVHGELLISKLSYAGEVLWSSGGKDIFTGGFKICDDYVEAVDFNNEKYRISILDGSTDLV